MRLSARAHFEMTGLEAPRAITRRSLLLAGAGAAAAAAIPDVAAAAAKKKKKKPKPSHLDRSTWEPLVGTLLETRNPGLPKVPLVLAAISEMPISYGQSEAFRQRTFALVFRGPADQPLADATHRLFVPGVGKIDIWFASAREIDGGWEYLAIFANARIKQRLPRKPKGRLSAPQRSEVKRAESAAERKRRSEKKRRRREREERRAERRRVRELLEETS